MTPQDSNASSPRKASVSNAETTSSNAVTRSSLTPQVTDAPFLSELTSSMTDASRAINVAGTAWTQPSMTGAMRSVINHLENLSPIELREPAMLGAYLALIFALPDSAVVRASLGGRLLSRIDDRFLQLLDALRVPDTSGALRGAAPHAMPFDMTQASILSAHFFIAARPSEAFSAAGVFDVSAWQGFIATYWRHLSITAPRLHIDAVRDLRPPDCHASFVRNVGIWAAEPGFPDENRAEAALLMQMCSEEGQTALDLSYLGLRSLPAALWLIDRPGSACSAAGGLRNLRLNDNCLKKLPEAIGQLTHLRKLSISRNHLLSLPAALGDLTELTSLQMSDNEISALPSSIGQLSALQSLLADGCLLTSLPDGLFALSSLREMDLDDNLLTSLPGDVARLPDTCIVRLFDNPLSSRVKQALTGIVNGPVCLVSDGGVTADTDGTAAQQGQDEGRHPHSPQQRSLTEAAFDWLDLSIHRTGEASQRWRALEVMPHAQALAVVLDSFATLAEANNWNTRIAFRQRVAVLLLSIVERPALGRVCLGVARDTLAQGISAQVCLARLEALVADDQAQHFGWSLPEILTLSLRRFRLQVIDGIASDALGDWPFADESDVQFAYRLALSTRVDVDLPHLLLDQAHTHNEDRSHDDHRAADVPAMSSPSPLYNNAPIRLSAEKIAAAVDVVSAAVEGDAVVSFLIDYAPWRAGLCRHERTHFEALLAEFDVEDEALSGIDTASEASPPTTLASAASADASLIEAKRRLKEAQAAQFSAQLVQLTTAWLRA